MRGRVRLLSNEEGYRGSFKRVEEDALTGWLDEKAKYAGMEGEVILTYDADQTATIVFDDNEKLDFPFESIAE